MSAGRTLYRTGLIAGLAAGALLPLATLVATSLGRDWHWPALIPAHIDATAWTGSLATGGRLGHALFMSLALAIATGALCAVLGLPAGRAIATLRGWRRRIAAGAAFLPIAAPPIALGVGLQYTLLSLGLGGRFTGVLLAHLVPAAGYATLYFVGVFALLDPGYEEAARSHGAGPWGALWRVTLPLMRRPAADAFLIGFLSSWVQFALTLVVGGGAVRTLPLEIFAYVGAGEDRYAAVGALLLLVPPLIALGVARVVAGRTAAVLV